MMTMKDLKREEMGLEWMLRPKFNSERLSNKFSIIEVVEAPAQEIKENPRELKPYLKDNGSGYPEDSNKSKDKGLLSTTVVGDGGASWRLKALKRGQEQAAHEGKKLQKVVEERWGLMGHFAASVASHSVTPTHADLQPIKTRRKGFSTDERRSVAEHDKAKRDFDQKSRKEFHTRNPKMRMPKNNDSLSWGKCGSKKLSAEDSALISAALSSLSKFSNDGSFMDKFMHQNKDSFAGLASSSEHKGRPGLERVGSATKEDSTMKLANCHECESVSC